MGRFFISIFLVFFFFPGQVYAGLSFVKTITLQDKGKEEVLLKQKFYTEGDRVRIEEDASDIEGNPGVSIYDFEKKKLYTIMLDVSLYMEQDIDVKKEYIMFEIPPEDRYGHFKNFKILREEQERDSVEGHPAVKYEVKVVRTVKKEKDREEEEVVERYFVWKAPDLGNIPVRYELTYPDGRKKIITYTEIKTGTLDPSLFEIPEGYTPISPF